MQEHIRRAHPEYYIPKLPATKESFDLMINTPPHEVEKPAPQENVTSANTNNNGSGSNNNNNNNNNTSTPNNASSNRKPQPPHAASQPHLAQSDATGLSPHFALDTGLNASFQGYHGIPHADGTFYAGGDAEASAIYSSMQAQARGAEDFRRGSLLPTASAAAARTVTSPSTGVGLGRRWNGTGDTPFFAIVSDGH